MTIVLLGILAIAAMGFLLSPLMFKPSSDSRALAIDPYRRQLAELEVEKERGNIPDGEAEGIRLEIERRLIREAQMIGTGGNDTAAMKMTPVTLFGLMLTLSVAVLAYTSLGRPDLSAGPAGVEIKLRQPPQTEFGDLEQMLTKVRARLAENPDEIEGWLILARSELALGRYEEAVNAFGLAAELRPDDAEIHIQQGQGLVGLHGGVITPAASLAFERAAALRPDHPAPRLYEGFRLFQEGKAQAALVIWRRLAVEAPADAPWLERLGVEIVRAEAVVARQEALLKGEEIPTLRSEQIEEVGEMLPEERQAFVESMVARLRARLAEQADDLEGWLRLAQAEEVLGNIEAAITALDHAAGLSGSGSEVDIAAWRERLAKQVAD